MSDEIKVGPAPIQTPEDAQMAFLRKEIDEKTYRDVLGKFGVVPGQAVGAAVVERPDSAFEVKIPDDLITPGPVGVDTEAVIKQAEAKAKLREAALKEAQKDDSPEKTVKRESDPAWVQSMNEKYLTASEPEQAKPVAKSA